jgi:hypothetical protein
MGCGVNVLQLWHAQSHNLFDEHGSSAHRYAMTQAKLRWVCACVCATPNICMCAGPTHGHQQDRSGPNHQRRAGEQGVEGVASRVSGLRYTSQVVDTRPGKAAAKPPTDADVAGARPVMQLSL